ncbi:MAG: YdbH domain-containing protein, partial [Gammaproteobacteria bacterium]|nr:YdbH domain-containing protein [Gammaproteobacteria bacterium]
VSRLSWNSGTVYNILIGGGAVNLQLGNDDVEMLAPLRLSVLGGALLINQLVLNNFGADDATGRLDAELEPIQLGQLTGAFGWPAFSGKLSGRLPLLQLAENTITVGGTLSARAFDGTMELSNLRIEQPFGLVPRLQGDLTIRDLDLQRVTEAFSFGLIQGRLSGDVLGLSMQNWRPVAMDMYFYTPPNDTSQHRISQRAVEDLASVGGGGAGAALSSGFLKFFDVFAYDQIGLRCVLKDGVCTMSGAGAAKAGPLGRGYYLVKGSGVPRIDVVGFRDRVSWPRLVQQLGAIRQGGSPTVN